MPVEQTFTGAFQSSSHDWNRYLFGGHWETEVGDILKLGATYLNLHQTKTKDSEESSIKGEVAFSNPETIYLKPTCQSQIILNRTCRTLCQSFDQKLAQAEKKRGNGRCSPHCSNKAAKQRGCIPIVPVTEF